jgi:hypothetical protein
MKLFRVIFCSLLLTLPCSLGAQAKHNVPGAGSVRAFVQTFYEWYAPRALGDSHEPAWNIALRTKGRYFSSELALRLHEDSDAQGKAEGEIVGLDFDPFLNTQDPGKHYEIGDAVKKGDSYWVQIRDASRGKTRKADVVAELEKKGQWHFVNFHYPNGQDLLGVLKELKNVRAGGRVK